MGKRAEIEAGIATTYSHLWDSTRDFSTPTILGPHNIGYGANHMAQALAPLLTAQGLVINEHQLEKTILDTALHAAKPEHLLPGAREMIQDALSNNEPVYIWTEGDHTKIDRGDHQLPGYMLQERKIVGTGLRRSLETDLGKKRVRNLLHVKPVSHMKGQALPEIFDSMEQQGITDVYVVDDRLNNLVQSQTMHADGTHQTRLHPVYISPNQTETPPGILQFASIRDYNRYIQEQRKPNEKIGHVVDWDSTLFNEGKRVQDTRETLSERLHLQSRLLELGINIESIQDIRRLGGNKLYTYFEVDQQTATGEVTKLRVPLITAQREEELLRSRGEQTTSFIQDALTISINDPFQNTDHFRQILENLHDFPRAEKAMVLSNIRKALRRMLHTYTLLEKDTSRSSEKDSLANTINNVMRAAQDISGETIPPSTDVMSTYKTTMKAITRYGLNGKGSDSFKRAELDQPLAAIRQALDGKPGTRVDLYGSAVFKGTFGDLDLVVALDDKTPTAIDDLYQRLEACGVAFAPTITDSNLASFSSGNSDIVSPFGTILIDGKECWIDLHIVSSDTLDEIFDLSKPPLKRGDDTRLDIPLRYHGINPNWDKMTWDGRKVQLPDYDERLERVYATPESPLIRGFFMEVYLYAVSIFGEDSRGTAHFIANYFNMLKNVGLKQPQDFDSFVRSLFNGDQDSYTPEALAYLQEQYNLAQQMLHNRSGRRENISA